jgi:hypothetical protein
LVLAVGCGAAGNATPASGGQSGSGGSGAVAGSGGVGGSGAAAGGGGAAGTGGAACTPWTPPKSCDAPLPAFTKRPWHHGIESPIIVATGSSNHRGRDLFLVPGEPQWIIGKFAYGIADKDLKDEEVDIYLLRGCTGSWEKLGTAITTQDNQHATEEGVDDSGGRIYFQIPAGKELGIGRHRVHLVVAGDLSSTDLYIEVVPQGTHLFASDVDGTLTTQETEEFTALLTGTTPNSNPDSPEALRELADKGYRPFYLTARPEFLVGRTREFLDKYGYPPGIVHTTTSLTGALGSAASSYKIGEIGREQKRGLVIGWGFGNTSSDADAYFSTGIAPASHRIMFQFTDSAHGSRRIDSYSELLGEFAALSPVCP